MRRLAARILTAAHDASLLEQTPKHNFSQFTASERCVLGSAPSFSGRTTAPSTGRNCARPYLQNSALVQRRSMFIQTQPTPNPASLMFIPGRTVMEVRANREEACVTIQDKSGSANFTSSREAMKSPLARKIFGTDGVKQVFFGSDFVTVTKSDDLSWSVLKPDILAAIADHIASGEPLLLDDEMQASSDTAIHDDDSEIVAMIKELLDTRIRPSVQEDGGDIQYRGFDEDTGVVTLKMQGACSGCPSSSVTLKSGIENMLMHYIPEVKEVKEADADEYEQMGVQEFNKLESQLSH